MEHAEIQELLGAYALDAVDPDEAQEIERHLATCPRCRAEVIEHREVAGLLGYAGSDAPAGLWDRIVESLEEPPPAMRLGPVVTDPSRTGQEPGDAADAGLQPSDGGSQAGAEVVGITSGQPGQRGQRGQRGRRTMGVRAFAAMAAIAALVAGILGIEVARVNNQTNNLKASIGVEAIAAAYQAARTNPGARQVTLRSSDGARSTQAVLLPDGTGYLDPHSLPALSRNQTYQLWGVIGPDRVSLAVLGNTPRIVQFGAPDNVSALAVTAERTGGVVVSQNQPVVIGSVTPLPQPPPTFRNAADSWSLPTVWSDIDS
jgi:anti-sigma factor RsiW